MRRSIHYWSLEQLLARLQSIARYVITVAHYFESMQNHSSCLELLVNSLISSWGNVKKQNASLSAQALWTCKKFKCNLLIIVLGYWVSIPQDFLTKDYFLWQTKKLAIDWVWKCKSFCKDFKPVVFNYLSIFLMCWSTVY